jgi:hypothetical protein
MSLLKAADVTSSTTFWETTSAASWSATVWRSMTTPRRSNRNATPIIIKLSVKPKTFTHSRARASYAKWPPCCAPPSHSKSRKLSSARKPSVTCVRRSNTKPSKDGIGQNDGEQQSAIFGRVRLLQMGKVVGETRSASTSRSRSVTLT